MYLNESVTRVLYQNLSDLKRVHSVFSIASQRELLEKCFFTHPKQYEFCINEALIRQVSAVHLDRSYKSTVTIRN